MRHRVCLSGQWRFHTDAARRGEEDGCASPEFNDSAWRPGSVPGCLEACAEDTEHYVGAAWFRRRFQVPADWQGCRIVLQFEGVNYHARVWLNGKLLGSHPHGFLPFEFPIHDSLRWDDENVLAVRVDGEVRPDEIPGEQIGWRHYAGILREVRLEASSLLHLDAVQVAAEPAPGGGSLKLSATIRNQSATPRLASLRVTLHDEDGRELVSLDSAASHVPADGSCSVSVSGSVPRVRPWSPAQPVLYPASIELRGDGKRLDQLGLRCGFRRIEARAGRILLNGEPVFLTGFNRHEDSPRTALASDLRTAREDLVRMKEAGANFVRLCHYPHHPGELDLCDELGLLAMAEIPLYWLSAGKGQARNCRAKLRAAREQLASLIARDRNHPAVVFWSVSNETHEQHAAVRAGNDELIRLAKQLDPTRFVVHVSDEWRSVPHFPHDDVICVNGYPNVSPWEGPLTGPNEAAALWRAALVRLNALYPDKPILVSEFGHPSLLGETGGSWGEDTAARAIEAEFGGMDAPCVCGATVWCFADHPWPPGRFLDGLGTSPFGVVTRERRPKQALAVISRLFRSKQGQPDAAVSPGPPPGDPNLTMIRPNLDDVPDQPFGSGYGVRPMKPGDAALWTDIWRDADPGLNVPDDLFIREFGSDWTVIGERCFLITASNDRAVGTISAWHNPAFRGQDYGRIHWVAIRPSHQGKGLAKPALAFALRTLAQWHQRCYLVTQVTRLPAIKLYLDFGFKPDVCDQRQERLWCYLRHRLKHPALATLTLTLPPAL